jgi:hypothetical protein
LVNAARAARALERASSSAENVKRIFVVKSDNTIPLEARIVWPDLYFDLCEGKPAIVAVVPSQVGAIMGRSDKAGRRALRDLHDAGLIRIEDRPATRADWVRAGSTWKIEVFDPLEAAIARPARECDGQAEFPGFGIGSEILSIGNDAKGERPSSEPTALVRQRSESTAKVELLRPCPDLRHLSAAHKTLDLRHKDFGRKGSASAIQRSEVAPQQHGQTGDDSAVPGRTIGELAMGIVSRLPTPLARLDQIRQLSARIMHDVGDSRLHPEKADELAEAIVDGRWTERLYLRVVATTRRAYAGETRSGIPNAPRWAYFLGAAFQSIRENDPRNR